MDMPRKLLILGIILLLLCQCLAYCPTRYPHDTCYTLYNAFETSLLSSNQNMYSVREEFFPSSHAPPIYGHVNYTLNINIHNEEIPCHSYSQSDENSPSQQSFSNHSHHHFIWSDSGLLSKFDPFTLSFYQMEILSSIFETVDIIDYRFYPYPPNPSYITLDITLNVLLPCTPSDDQIETSLKDLTSWLKVYAKDQGKPQRTWDIANKGYGVLASNVDSGSVYGLLFATYISISISVTILMWGLSSQAYTTVYTLVGTSRDHYCLFWATAVVAFLLNAVAIISEPVLATDWLVNLQWPKVSNWAVMFFLAKIIQIFLYIVSDFVVAFLIVVVFNPTLQFHLPRLLEVIANEYCCCRFCGDNGRRHRFLQVLATWNIMLSIHLISIGSVPTFLWMLVEPIRMLSVVALVCGGTFTAILFVATLFSILPMTPFEHNNISRYTKYKLMLMLMTIPFLFTTVTLLFVLYFKLIATVVNTSTPTGILVSFIPSLALTVTGWFLSAKIRDALSTRNQADGGNDNDIPIAQQRNGGDIGEHQMVEFAQQQPNDGGEHDLNDTGDEEPLTP